MTIKERMEIVEEIGSHLQSNYTYADIDVILAAFSLPNNGAYDGNNSKRVYVKHRLKGASESVLLQIQKELELVSQHSHSSKVLPKNWTGKDSAVKFFISHLSQHKIYAKRLKDCLELNNVVAFVAHEDILPTETWMHEIKNALDTMDVFISLHTEGFNESIWCQQEVGYAFGTGKKMIPIKFDGNPVGFLSSIQALNRRDKKAEDITKEIFQILKQDKDTKYLYDKIFPPTDDLPW